MVEKHQNDFADDLIRSFLLGEMTGRDQSQFEERLLTDDELAGRVRLAELELCDEYAAAGSSGPERQVFRERFLLTTGRRQTLKVSTALGDRFTTTPSEHSIIERMKSLINLHQAVWRYAFAALILIMVLTTALLVTRDHSRIATWIPKRVAPRPTATALPQISHHSANRPAPDHNEQSPALPLHESLEIDAVLFSQTAISSAAVIKQPNKSRRVLIELVLDEPRSESYYINLMTVSGDTVFATDSKARVDDNKILFYVPGEVMKVGDYQISLTRIAGESKEDAGVYYLRVR
ncbi:MAG: hypothetical protein ABR607_14340 [Pyrinomonadaceae bacterium]